MAVKNNIFRGEEPHILDAYKAYSKIHFNQSSQTYNTKINKINLHLLIIDVG